MRTGNRKSCASKRDESMALDPKLHRVWFDSNYWHHFLVDILPVCGIVVAQGDGNPCSTVETPYISLIMRF